MRHFLKIILVLFFGSVSTISYAQERCTTEEYNQKFYDQGRKVNPEKFQKWIVTLKSQSKLGTLRTAAEPSLIPVVIHVIHNGETLGSGVNISEEQIISQINVLNEDFQRQNSDTIQTPNEFKLIASALNIEFVLAKRDPSGLPTNGIIRKQGSRTSWDPIAHDDQLKAESYWPAEDYLNIWVCNLTGDNLGYAQYPDANLQGLEGVDNENRLTDGVVLDYVVCGSSDKGNFPDLRIPYDKGRTASHEVGHWLGLLHIFATPGNCTSDDYIDDTPRQNNSYNAACPTHPVSSCSSVDMFQNYMDYTADDCMNIFTMGQVDRMQLILDNAVRRNSLLNAIGAFPPDIEYDDLALLNINTPSRISCYRDVQPVVTIQNMGTNTITEVSATYGMEGSQLFEETISFDSLYSGQQRLLYLPGFTVTNGNYTFICQLEIVGKDDLNPENNYKSLPTIIDNARVEVPFIEKFDYESLDESLWTVINSDSSITWETNKFKSYTTGAIKLYNYNRLGEEDWLISPIFDYTLIEAAALRFDVSYAVNEGFMDYLTILASYDCGNSFIEIYSEEGSAFSIENSSEFWGPSTDNDWKTILLDLNEFAGYSDVRLAFITTNGFGNNLYLDNIELFVQSIHDIVEIPEGEIVLFPNPSENPVFNLGIQTAEKETVVLRVFNSNGQLVLYKELTDVLNQVYSIDLTGNRKGVYIIKVDGNSINAVSKLIYKP